MTRYSLPQVLYSYGVEGGVPKISSLAFFIYLHLSGFSNKGVGSGVEVGMKGVWKGGGYKKFFGIFYLLAPVWIYKQIVTFLAYPEDTIPGDGWGGVMGVVE